MHQGRGGMGSHKHGTAGHPTKSPKFRLATKLEAEKDVKRDQKSVGMKPSIKELFKRK